jgi:hypothetical protein
VNNPGHTPLQLLLKVLQFKNTAQMTRVHANQLSKEERQAKQEEQKMVVKLESPEERKADEENKAENEEDQFLVVDESYLEGFGQEVAPLSQKSDYTRVNPVTAQTDFKHFNPMLTTYLIGPQNPPKHKENFKSTPKQGSQPPKEPESPQGESIDIFAPVVYINTSTDASEKNVEPFRIFVFLGHKTMTVLFFKPDFEFTYKFIQNLTAHLSR